MQVDLGDGEVIDTDNLTYTELLTVQDRLAQAIIHIKSQLEYQEIGEREAPPVWVVRAKAALRHKNRENMLLLKLMSERRRQENIEKARQEDLVKTWHQHFVQVCKEQLSQSMFEYLADLATEREIQASIQPEKQNA